MTAERMREACLAIIHKEFDGDNPRLDSMLARLVDEIEWIEIPAAPPEMAAGFDAALAMTRKAVADQCGPTFAERVAELEAYMQGLPFGTIDAAAFNDLLQCVREQQAALSACEAVLCGDEMSKSALVNAIKSARATLSRWNVGEKK